MVAFHTSKPLPPLALCASPWTLLSCLFLNPALGAGIEKIQRERSAIKHFVVEAAQIELRSEFLLGAFAQLADLELAKLVAERLGWPGNVAVGFRLDRRLIDRARLPHEIHDLIAAPAFGMDSGIDLQPHGAEQ